MVIVLWFCLFIWFRMVTWHIQIMRRWISGDTYLIHCGTIILKKSHWYCKWSDSFIFPLYIHCRVFSLAFCEQPGVNAMREQWASKIRLQFHRSVDSLVVFEGLRVNAMREHPRYRNTGTSTHSLPPCGMHTYHHTTTWNKILTEKEICGGSTKTAQITPKKSSLCF